jgi:imidazolonepropionase-like amidohydrolase
VAGPRLLPGLLLPGLLLHGLLLPGLLLPGLLLPALLLIASCKMLVPPATPDSSLRVAIVDVTIVDVVAGSVLPHGTVVVADGHITAVGESARVGVPHDARVVDGRGRFLIPGLWDMHSHSLWSPEAMRTFLPLYVANGVTGIRDMGGRLDVLATARAAQRQGKVAYPRIVAAGMILDGPEPVQADVSIAVADAAAARTTVDSLAHDGVDFIKVYTLLPRDAYFAVIEEARRLGLPVAGHVPAAVTIEEAARAGQRSIEHLHDELEPLCTPQGAVQCRRLAAVFRQYHTWQVPTLVALRKGFFDDEAIVRDPRLRYIPRGLREDWLAERAARIGRGAEHLAGKRRRYADEEWLAGFLAREHVGLLAGTDAGTAFCYPGFSLHDELGRLVQAGLSPLDALRTATLAPAEFLGKRDSMGAIAVGQDADLVLLRSNPLADIAATREIDAVLLRGRVLDRRDLDALLATVAGAVEK